MLKAQNAEHLMLSPEQATAIGQLSLLQTVCDRLSHTIRTPLGVSMGVIDDILANFEITTADLSDAKDALHTIHRVLNDVRDFSNTPTFVPVSQNLVDKVTEWGEERFGLDFVESIKISTSCESSIAVIDEKLLQRAMRVLANYLGKKRKQIQNRNDNYVDSDGLPATRMKELDKMTLHVELKSLSARDKSKLKSKIHNLVLRLSGIEKVKAELETEVRSLESLAECDHAPESLGLLFVVQVIALHDGRVEGELNGGIVTAFNIYL